MPRRRIRRDRIPRATITIKLDVDLIQWLNGYDNRSQMVENAVNRLKRTMQQENTNLLSFDEDCQGTPEAVRLANLLNIHIMWYGEKHGIRPKTTRFLKYELRQWSKAVRTFEETGEVDE